MTERFSPDSEPRAETVQALPELLREAFLAGEIGVWNILPWAADEIERLRASVKPDVAQAALTGIEAADLLTDYLRMRTTELDAGDAANIVHFLNEKGLLNLRKPAVPQAACGTGDLVNRLIAPPVTLKTGQEAAYVIAELEAENKRLRAQPQAAPTSFDEWFDSNFIDPDGKSSHLPDWFKPDMQRAWNAALTRPQRSEDGK